MAAAAVMAVAAIFVFVTLPPRPVEAPLGDVGGALLERTVAGAYHVHTTRSDGAGDRHAVAAAAARAGLNFVILTDHGDATRAPDPPAYIGGVLFIDATEISTNGGHYVALGLPAAPYPLGGEASAVVEDVARFGGFGLAAHPDHPKPELAWSNWDLPIDGLEWFNADSEWRNEPPLRLAHVLIDYLVRPAPALASVLDRPETTLGRWNVLLRRRPVVALAAVDAHGGARGNRLEEGGSRYAIGPSYEAAFRMVSNRVVLDRPFAGDARQDAGAVLAAIRHGRVYSVITAVSPSVAVDFEDGPRVVSTLPRDATVVKHGPAEARWLEVTHPNAPGEPPVPWVMANPGIQAPPEVPQSGPAEPAGAPLEMGSPWRVEKDPGSSGQLEVVDGGFRLRYQLRAGERVSQYVAAAADLGAGQPFETIAFSAKADRPMRVSVQLRLRPDDARWVKSVYVDAAERRVVIPVGELTAADRRPGSIPLPVAGRSVLFVVDLTNASPGDAGALTITGVRVSAQSPGARQ